MVVEDPGQSGPTAIAFGAIPGTWTNVWTSPVFERFPSGSARLVQNPETLAMMADGSLLRSGGETWGPVSPDNVHETGVSPPVDGLDPLVAAEAEQVERTRRKTWSRSRSEVFVPYR
jgi:hypothetical protein